jgi:hypothetical protein
LFPVTRIARNHVSQKWKNYIINFISLSAAFWEEDVMMAQLTAEH